MQKLIQLTDDELYRLFGSIISAEADYKRTGISGMRQKNKFLVSLSFDYEELHGVETLEDALDIVSRELSERKDTEPVVDEDTGEVTYRPKNK